MKLCVISDIHGSLPAFEQAAAVFEKEKALCMIICGDYLNHGPRNDIPQGYNTKQLALRLNMMKNYITGVRGNCDSEVDQMLLDFPMMSAYTQLFLPQPDFLPQETAAAEKDSNAALPEKAGTEQEGAQMGTPRLCGRIFVHHGHLYTQEQAASLTPPGSIIISGHTHVPELRLHNNHVFLNPGSLSIPKGGSKASYALIETVPRTDYFQFMRISLHALDGTLIDELTL